MKTRAGQAAARPDRPLKFLARPTVEGVALMFEALTGREASPEALARAEAKFAAAESARRTRH